MLLGFMPWVTPMMAAMVRSLSRRRDPVARTGLYAGAGLLAGLLFFTLCSGKLPNYLLPLAPLVALLATWELGRELDDPHLRRLGPAFLAGTLAAFAVLLGVAGIAYVPDEARSTALAGSTIYGVCFVGSLVGVIGHRPRWVFGSAAVASAGFLLVAFSLFIPAHSTSRSSWSLVREVPELSGQRPLAVVDMDLPSLTFYLDRVPEKLPMAWVGDRLQDEDDLLMIFDRSDLGMLPPEISVRLRWVGEAGKYVVMEQLHDRPESGNLLDGSDPPR
jgi:4-amino-4-deoxy-L-arabinose transferase-like glycosyltransferase